MFCPQRSTAILTYSLVFALLTDPTNVIPTNVLVIQSPCHNAYSVVFFL
jgi:hypothetical protein